MSERPDGLGAAAGLAPDADEASGPADPGSGVAAGRTEADRGLPAAEGLAARKPVLPPHALSIKYSARGLVHTNLRVGVMGGTFDPIHNGHLVAASEVAWVYDLDEVIFVPAGRPVFKRNKSVTDGEDRYLMTVIATSANPRFTVSRVDIDRPGDTYTIDTLHDLRREYGPDAELFFITGADAVAEILRWKDAEEMFTLAHFVAVSRPGYPVDTSALPSDRVDVLEIPALAISSTDVRRRASHGEPIWYLVPDGVVQYIGKHGLYRGRD